LLQEPKPHGLVKQGSISENESDELNSKYIQLNFWN